jgi:nucleoside-diphosphate-sugar epimerase
MRIQKILVTGASGRVGKAVVQDLEAHGYQVTPADKSPGQNWSAKIVNCEDLGQVIGAMHGHDAVIHLAAIPHPVADPPEIVFRNNVLSAFNILEAAAVLGVKTVVLASSISALGFAFGTQPFSPLQIPIDETHPLLSQDVYGLSKMVGEVLADGYCRRIPDLCLSSLRFSFVVDDNARQGYLNAPENKPRMDEFMANNFWTYVDVRDTAVSCRLAMEAARPGHEAFFINASTTLSDQPVEALLTRFFPGDYPVAAHIRGSASPVDCGKAERLLGWKAQYDWLGNEFSKS